MKKKSKILSFALSVILLAGSLSSVGVNATTAPYITSDTNTNVTLAAYYVWHYNDGPSGIAYTVKLTVHGSAKAPVVTVGNGKLIKVALVNKAGQDYFYKISMVNTEQKLTEATGVYAALPGQQYKRIFAVTVGDIKQLYPKPAYGTILYDHEIPESTYWYWEKMIYYQEYKNGHWIPQFSYMLNSGINDDNIDQYETDLETKFPDVANNLPTDVPKNADDSIRDEHDLFVYLDGDCIWTENWLKWPLRTED